MRWLFVGNFEPSHSTENHLASTLEGMGHVVIRRQEVGSQAVTAEQVAACLHLADVLLWTRTPPGIRGDAFGMLATARRMGVPSVVVHLDLFAGLPRAAEVAHDAWWTSDLVCTADGGSDEFWAEHGVNHRWLPPAVFEPEAYMAERDGDYWHDVVFTGQKAYHPAWPYRPQLIDWLSWNYGNRFRRFPMPGEHAVRGAALNRLYAHTKVVVGDSLCLGFTHQKYWSDRVPEATGRGAFLIMPRIVGLEDLYVEDKEMVFYTFGDFDEMKRKIDYYLEHDEEREAIRRAGHAATLRHSTYRHRMETLIEWLP